MTPLRHNDPTIDLFDGRYLARSLAVTYGNGHLLPLHHHPWAQLIYAARGVMLVETEETAWLVPTTRAIWVPARVPHRIRMRSRVAMRTLYVAAAGANWPDRCRALEVSALLRELTLHMVEIRTLDPTRADHERLMGVFADLLCNSEAVPLTLPLPRDSRARTLADRVLEEPGRAATLAELARDTGASPRTLQRLFQAQTGLSLESWRLRARMQQGVVALSGGASVTEAALTSGYRSASAFISAFKRSFGVTPSRYGGDAHFEARALGAGVTIDETSDG
jgi:AraC-like DNA-binding protein